MERRSDDSSAKRKKRQHPVDFPYGAAQASEVQYLFDLGKVAYPGTLTAAQRQLAGTMKPDWTDLAKSGVPERVVAAFTAASQQTLSLVPPHPQVETDYSAEHNCAFWAAAG